MYKNFSILSIITISSLTFSAKIFSAPGDLDPTFNPSGSPAGTLSFSIPGQTNSIGNSTAIQSDGKIVVAGYAEISGQRRFAIARFNPDGSPDTTFNTTGSTTIIIDGQTGTDNATGNSTAIQSDGKIVVAGYASISGQQRFAVACFNANGSPDGTFGSAGSTTIIIDGQTGADNAIGYSTAIQSDGKIVVAGYAEISGQYRFAVARFNANGSPDPTFNNITGSTTTTITGQTTGSAIGYSVALQNDDKIVVAGYALIGSKNEFALARFNTNGSLDNSFGTAGSTTITITGQTTGSAIGYSTAIQSDGKIVVAGEAEISDSYRFAVARLNANGSPDTTFDTTGSTTIIITGQTGDSYGFSTAIQSDGKIVVSGEAEISFQNRFAVARLNTNGSPDTTFGSAGSTTIIITGQTGDANGISTAIQSDGKIVVAGYADILGQKKFAVARFEDDQIAPENKINNCFALRLIEKYGPLFLQASAT